MSKVRINQGRVMNGYFRFFATLIGLCMAIVIIVKVNNELGFVLLCLIAFLLIPIWTSFYMLEVDTENKVFHDLTMVLGRRFGKSKEYSQLREIFIKPQGYSQNYNRVTGEVQEIKFLKYDSYLTVDEQNIFILSDEDEQNLIAKLRPIAKKLGTVIRQS